MVKKLNLEVETLKVFTQEGYMELKVDENSNVILQDGKPVYVFDDGKESPFDAPAAMKKISSLNAEAKDYRLKLSDAKEQLDKFSVITDVDAAINALETVKNLEDKKLVDAGKVDEIKQSMSRIFDEEKARLLSTHKTQLDQAVSQVKEKDSLIHSLVVKQQFSNSPFFTGDNPKTTLFPDAAAKYFGDKFKVEAINGELAIVGYLNGEKILSKERYGEPASFNEAIEVIIENDPLKNQILSSSSSGSSSNGNVSGGGTLAELILSTTDAKDVVKYRKAKEEADKRNIPLIIK